MYRYYLVERGPGPGAQPNGIINCKDYNKKEFIYDLCFSAWGYAEYEKPLTIKQIEDFELSGPYEV